MGHKSSCQEHSLMNIQGRIPQSLKYFSVQLKGARLPLWMGKRKKYGRNLEQEEDSLRDPGAGLTAVPFPASYTSHRPFLAFLAPHLWRYLGLGRASRAHADFSFIHSSQQMGTHERKDSKGITSVSRLSIKQRPKNLSFKEEINFFAKTRQRAQFFSFSLLDPGISHILQHTSHPSTHWPSMRPQQHTLTLGGDVNQKPKTSLGFWGRRFGSHWCSMVKTEQTTSRAPPAFLLLFSFVKRAFETHYNTLDNALHIKQCVLFKIFRFEKNKKETTFFPLILIHVSGHIVTPDAFHFLQYSWERRFLNLCAYQKYAYFMYSVLSC